VTLTPGTRLGPYEILAAIGRGGMGEVYRARDTRLKREIAIKILPAHVTSQPNRRQRFEREAQAVAAVSHPHICALFDVGSQDGIDFLVMEYLEGDTLDRRLVRGALPPSVVFQHAIEIAEALDHAHRHGIVHRDLKPANIMLTKAGVKLLDFGLAGWNERQAVQLGNAVAEDAAELPDTESLTAEGTILGTLPYMAPEQLEGKRTDGRADLFAFGAVLYEMATGRKAFSGGSHASVIAAILLGEPAPIAAHEPLTPAGLERIVKKCLAKDPELRWQTARDLLDELKWVAEGGSQEALALESGARRSSAGASERGRSARLRWAGAGLLAVIAAVAGGMFLWSPLFTGSTERLSVRDLQVLVFEDQQAGFENAVRTLGIRTVIDFEDVDPGPVTNSVTGRPPFDGFHYAARGIVFSNPNKLPLYIAPRGLFWNPTNSLSVGPFPFHPLDNKEIEAPFIQDDDIGVTFEPGCSAVAFSVIDKGDMLFDNFVEFIDTDGQRLRLVSLPRAFLGLVAPVRPDGVQVRISRLLISEAGDDGDDVTYDDFICIR
jgi:hypothetical protein